MYFFKNFKKESNHDTDEPLTESFLKSTDHSVNDDTDFLTEDDYDRNQQLEDEHDRNRMGFGEKMAKRLRREEKKGDNQRRLVNFIGLVLIVFMAIFIYFMRTCDWSTSYLITETLLDGNPNVVVNSTTTVWMESDLFNILGWWDYNDGFVLFKIFARLFMNVIPILKTALGAAHLVTLIYGPVELRKSRWEYEVIDDDLLRRYGDNDEAASPFSEFWKPRNWLNAFFSIFYILFDRTEVAYIIYGPKQNGILYMLLFFNIATHETFQIDGVKYIYQFTGHAAPVMTQLLFLFGLISENIKRAQWYRWKRREYVLNKVKERRLAHSSEQDNINSAEVNDVGSTVEEDSISSRLRTYWSKFGVQQKTTFWVCVAFFSRFLLQFVPMIKLEYTGASTIYLPKMSETFTLPGIIEAYLDRCYSSSDKYFMGIIFYFEILFVPNVLLGLTVLLKAIRYADNENEWVYPLYILITYAKCWCGLDTFFFALLLSFATLKFAVRELFEDQGRLICESLDVGEEECYGVEMRLEAGSYIFFLFLFAFGKSAGWTTDDLFRKFGDVDAIQSYGVDFRDIDTENYETDNEVSSGVESLRDLF